jgi:cytochrome c
MAGTLEGYKFSQALIDSTIVWNEQTIHQLFTEGPDVVLPGTKMPIQRMKSSKDRVDLIKFLKEATE